MMWQCKLRTIYSSSNICLACYTSRSSKHIENYYALLDVEPNAVQEDIRKAFLKKSKLLHPDTSIHYGEDTHEEFVNLHKAYSILSKPKLREKYDIQLQQAGGWSGPRIPVKNPYRSSHYKNPYVDRQETSERWTDYYSSNGQKRARYNMENNYDNSFWQNYWSFSREYGGGGPKIAGHDLNETDIKPKKNRTLHVVFGAMFFICVIPILPLFVSDKLPASLEETNKDYMNWVISKFDFDEDNSNNVDDKVKKPVTLRVFTNR